MPRTRPPIFPELEKQIMMQGVRKTDIASSLHISAQSLSRKLTGQVEFTLHEIEQIAGLFPKMSWESLFERERNEQGAGNTPLTG